MNLTHLDAGVVIGYLDAEDAHHAAASTALSEARHRRDNLAMSASALAECLVAPARRGEGTVELVRNILERIPIAVVDVDPQIAATAAGLRAAHRTLRLPDALVIASASVAGADRLVTTDHRWPSAKALGIAALIEQI